MPKFSENEKAIIKEKLHIEGERLFIQHGIKKVTVDDLVKAAGIAKGSFYAFYKNKEHLYMEIMGILQKKMLEDKKDFLKKNCPMPPKELMKKVILWFFREAQKYPMVIRQDSETTEYLFRKLPKEVMDAHTHEDKQDILELMEYGITFKCDIEIATKTLQMLAITFLNLQSDMNDNYDNVMEIMLNGVINEIVRDDYDSC